MKLALAMGRLIDPKKYANIQDGTSYSLMLRPKAKNPRSVLPLVDH
jgi:hypothetical protein